MPAVCRNCGTVLEEAQLNPCPKCGSMGRNYVLNAEPGHLFLSGASANFDLSLNAEPGHLTITGYPESLTLSGPSVLLQAVVTLGEKTSEGHLIEAVTPAWFEIARMIEADPSFMYTIDSRKWEELIAGWYERQGFQVTLTPRSADRGRDVIAEKPGVLCVRIIDQVKAFAPDRPVTANDVRALLGVLHADQAANKGLVTTTSVFAPGIYTDPYIKPFMPTRLELVNGAELRRRLAEVTERQPRG